MAFFGSLEFVIDGVGGSFAFASAGVFTFAVAFCYKKERVSGGWMAVAWVCHIRVLTRWTPVTVPMTK